MPDDGVPWPTFRREERGQAVVWFGDVTGSVAVGAGPERDRPPVDEFEQFDTVEYEATDTGLTYTVEDGAWMVTDHE